MHKVISVIGKINVGKSTLINSLIKNKITITSKKPQTTNSFIIENYTLRNLDIIFIDVPGPNFKFYSILNLNINYKFFSSFIYSDIILFVVENIKWTNEDYLILEFIKYISRKKNIQVNIFLVLNKIDYISNKKSYFPLFQVYLN